MNNKHEERRRKSRHIPYEILIGFALTLITFIIQSTALFTPYWKNVSPTTISLYVDGVDALIRTEVLHYFEAVHRNTHYNYGIFHRCQTHFPLNKSLSDVGNNIQTIFNTGDCQKNNLPGYPEGKFNDCHSLAYYRSCTTGVSLNSDNNHIHFSSCECHAPTYIRIAQFCGITAIVFLVLLIIIDFALICYIGNGKRCLNLFLGSVLLNIFILIFISLEIWVMIKNFRYEPLYYLTSIGGHYKTTQISKLSRDVDTVTDKFLSSIRVEMGYSTFLGFGALILCIIGLLFRFFTLQKKSCRTQSSQSIEKLPKPSQLSDREPHSATDQHRFLPLKDDEV